MLSNDIYHQSIEYICLHKKTKREHFIDGWLCITAYSITGYIIPLLDIWAGFELENKKAIKEVLKKACKKHYLKFAE